MKPKFSSGDKVFAKVRGYPPWPARVEGLADETPNKMRYHIYFYGTGETAVVKGEDICSFVENKTRLGKPKKHKNFTEALIQIEAELSPEEQQTLAGLEQSFKEQTSLNDTSGDDAKRLSTTGKSKTSLSPTPKVNKPKEKKRKVDSDSGTEEDQKKRASVVNNSDSEHKNAEVMSRSGRKIKPKRFADFEDDGTEEHSPVHQPIKPISKVAPVKKIDKDDTGDDKYVIAYVNNEKVKIPLGYNQPQFSSEQRLNEWKFKERSYANALKKRLESGEALPFDIDAHMFKWTKENAEQPVIHDNLMRTEIIKTETLLLELDLQIRSALNIKNADTKKCLTYLDQLSQLKLTALMLKKHPDVVHTIKKVRRYVGNVPRALTEEEEQEFHKDAEEIRNKAEHVYSKFQSLFFFPNSKSFWDAFEEEREKFDKLTKHMNSEEIVGMIKEPE